MSSPSPRQVFNEPGTHWAFITHASATGFEGQHFDRKEAGQTGVDATTQSHQVDGIRNHVKETISAFANKNVEGGLLILGIANNGAVKGINHLSEQQLNSITDFDTLLHHQAAEAAFHDCTDETGTHNKVCVIFVPHADNAICETPGRNPRAWLRSGPQNVPMTQEMRDRIKALKRVVDFEAAFCCPFSVADVDPDVLTEFRNVFSPSATKDFSDERLLYEAGAITQRDGAYCFTHAGLLFFGSNPQRVLPHSYIRLLRFGVPSGQFRSRGLPIYPEQQFKGPVTKQIRQARTFFRESAFFKRYQRRKQGGGFVDEPELPSNAIDEAIVNAVAHREYRTGLPVECESYTDAFIVKNPGRILQRGVDLPNAFSLSDTALDSMPRNPKLLEWLKLMKDPDGAAYVQAVSEGTKQMLREMTALALPAPSYRLGDNETLLKLESNAEAREAALLAASQVRSTEFGNLYPLQIRQGDRPATKAAFSLRYREFVRTLRDVLSAHGWYIDRFGFSRMTAHRRGTELDISAVKKLMWFVPAYEFQIREYFNAFYLCIDYRCHVLNVLRLNALTRYFPTEELAGRRCIANKEGWREGRVTSFDTEFANVFFFDTEAVEQVAANLVIPNCSLTMMRTVLQREGLTFDLSGTIKKHSLASKSGASRERAERITKILRYISDTCFPIQCGDFEVAVSTDPVQLVEQGVATDKTLPVVRLSEPAVEFREHHAALDVRKGITEYGAYDDVPHMIELVPVCDTAMRRNMDQLIERLKTGKYKYRGAERTFATRFTYSAIVTVEQINKAQVEVERLLREHPEWEGDKALPRLFLVHAPEEGYAQDDVTSPYYCIKRLLLERGVPCQMVDTPTLLDADWKDLNLALNITAKCGVTPWVLPDAIPDADFFIGLSHTQSRDGQRIMGFANVFNSYGKWLFYSGNTAFFDYEEKTERFARLVADTLTQLANRLSPTPRIILHHSEKLSREDRDAVLAAARTVCPDGTFVFVWVNSHHNVRFFDNRPETDGSLRRGSYVQAGANKIYLSTTGSNPFRRAMGTPKPLEVTAWTFRPNKRPRSDPDLRVLAVQVLNLTKLNWASTDSFCGEPITLKYAGDIAYLTAAFLRQAQPFNLHPALETTPWFI